MFYNFNNSPSALYIFYRVNFPCGVNTKENTPWRTIGSSQAPYGAFGFFFPWVDPGLPRYVRIALTGLTRVSPQCPDCGVGHLGVTWGVCRHHERASAIVRLALGRGSPEWAPRGRPREAYRTHPLWSRESRNVDGNEGQSFSFSQGLKKGKTAYHLRSMQRV